MPQLDFLDLGVCLLYLAIIVGLAVNSARWQCCAAFTSAAANRSLLQASSL